VRDNRRPSQDDWLWLGSLLVAGTLALAVFAFAAHRFTNGQGGVPLDDAWIHFQFARNLARGNGLSFNPGVPTSGSTAPLWTFVLAAAYLVGGRFPAAGQLLSGMSFLATLAMTYLLGRRLTGRLWSGWLAGAVVCVNGRMIWAGLSALETCLFAALSLGAITSYLNDRTNHRYRLLTSALFGLAALSRPEGYLLFALSLADFLWTTISALPPSQATPDATYIPRFLLPIALFAVIVLPYLLFSLHTSGHLLPNTYHAKATAGLLPDRQFRDVLSVAARYLILDNPLLLPFLLFGCLLSLERAPVLVLWTMGLPLAYAFLRTPLYQHGRYLMPLIPCNAVLGVYGLLEARKLARRRGWRPKPGSPYYLGVLISALVILGTGWRLPTMTGLYAWNVDNINEMHVALGQWVADHTPPDALLALNDIGAITYVSERPVVDLAGLITPEIIPLLRAPDRDSRLIALLAARNVQYVIIFPNWFPGLASRDDLLETIHQVTLERNTVAGGDTMVVYQARW
jgi:arabinofuranosyltransferase